MATLGVTVLVIKSELVDLEPIDTVDADSLNWGILHIEVVDLGVGELMSREELGLRDATVSTLSIPVLLTPGVENGTGALNSDLISRYLHKRALPLLVTPGGSTLEDDLGVVLQLAKVQGLSARNRNIVENDGSARSLGLAGLGGTAGTGKGAAAGTLSVSVNIGGLGDDGS